MPGVGSARAAGACIKICTRKMHLQEALNKIQGRIATIIGKIQQAEENDARMKLEREKLELLRLRATGRVEVPDEEDAADDPLHK